MVRVGVTMWKQGMRAVKSMLRDHSLASDLVKLKASVMCDTRVYASTSFTSELDPQVGKSKNLDQ